MRTVQQFSLGTFLAAACFLVIVTGASAADAQIYECNGVYTNHSECGLTGNPVVRQGVSRSGPSDISRKRSLIHDLRMRNLSAERDYQVSLSLRETELFCLKTETAVEDCRKEVDTQDEKLERRIVERAKIEATKREPHRPPSTRIEQNQTSVTVQQPGIVVSNIGSGGVWIGNRYIIGGGYRGIPAVIIPPTAPQPVVADLPSLAPGGSRLIGGAAGASSVPLSVRVPLGQ